MCTSHHVTELVKLAPLSSGGTATGTADPYKAMGKPHSQILGKLTLSFPPYHSTSPTNSYVLSFSTTLPMGGMWPGEHKHNQPGQGLGHAGGLWSWGAT